MNEGTKQIAEILGFSEEVKSVEEKKCPFCKKPIKTHEFKTEADKKENEISGLCQKCIDEVFET